MKVQLNDQCMGKVEIFQSLNEAQRREFDNDIEDIITRVISTGNLHTDKIHEVKVNMRLQNEVFLNVTLEFISDENQRIKGTVKDITKFDNVDDYLDSINKSNQDDHDWTNLK